MKILLTFALQEETTDLPLPGHEARTLITGVGKARAAMRLTRAIMEDRPGMVVNVGTAGTLRHRVGDILVCTNFIDRDHAPLALPGLDYELRDTARLEGTPLEGLRKAGCGHTANTGDDFVTAARPVAGDVVDMEAFAEALVCREFGIPFVAVKCVTDIIGQNSVTAWTARLEEARRALREFFTSYL